MAIRGGPLSSLCAVVEDVQHQLTLFAGMQKLAARHDALIISPVGCCTRGCHKPAYSFPPGHITKWPDFERQHAALIRVNLPDATTCTSCLLHACAEKNWESKDFQSELPRTEILLHNPNEAGVDNRSGSIEMLLADWVQPTEELQQGLGTHHPALLEATRNP